MAGVGVADGYHGQGLGRLMTAHTHELALSRGFTHSVVQCTNSSSHRVFRELGYTCRITIPYEEFDFAGRHPFTGILNRDRTAPELACTFSDAALLELGDGPALS